MDGLVVINKNSKCNFCGRSKNDHFRYGPIYKLGAIKAHYYCVLLSNRIIQNGNDNEGLLGFLLSDIQNELQRTVNVFCVYCKKGNATIHCAAKKCKKSFHLPCGLKSGSLHQFTEQFRSFCHAHRPVQNIPENILKEASQTEAICCICYDQVNVKNKRDTLWAPCCLKTWYHRYCAQKLAYSEGYFFRCAICNNDQKFNKWMQKFGIFIPQQDASWELVPNAYEELLFRYNKCDAEKCKCPEGRQKNSENTRWEIVLCETCGSQGIHVACGNLKFVDPTWECSSCQEITYKMKSSIKVNDSIRADEGSSKMIKTEICQKKRRRGSEDSENSVLDKRKKRRNIEVENEEENEIDVEIIDEEPKLKNDDFTEAFDMAEELINEETELAKSSRKTNFQEVLRLLKPGPLSYKLSMIKKAWGNSLIPVEKPTAETDAEKISTDIELIGLGDEKEENQIKNQCSKTEVSENEEGFSGILKEEEIEDSKSSFLCFGNSDVICTYKFKTEKKLDVEVIESTSHMKFADNKVHCTDTNSQNNFSTLVEFFSRCPGKEIFSPNCKLEITNLTKEVETVDIIDDEVIILSD